MKNSNEKLSTETGQAQACGLPDPLAGLQVLTDRAGERAGWTAFSDLSWCRLTPWRTLVAGFFDLPEYRSSLDRIREVRIECAGPGPEQVGVEALLLAGWLASRLKWTTTSKPQWIDETTYQWRLDGGDTRTPIEIRIGLSSGQVCAGVSRVELVVDQEPPLTFSAGLGPDPRHLESWVRAGRMKRSPRLIQVGEDDEAALLARELAIRRHDRVYEQALEYLAANAAN